MKSRREKGRVNIPLFIASLLVCGVLLSMYFTSGVLARYTTGVSAGDKARVAVFSTSLERKAGENDAVLTYAFPVAVGTGSNENGYTLMVKNDSEVAIRYTVELRFKDAVPAYLSVDGVTVDEDNPNVIKLDGGDLTPNSGEVEFPIEFSIDLDKFTEDADGLSASAELDFDAFVRFVQID